MRNLLPYLAILDAAFLAAGCGGNTTGDAGADGTASDVISTPDITVGGCFEAGTGITYEVCTDASAADACAASCTVACDRDYGAASVNSCTDDGLDGGTAFATCVHTLCTAGRRPVGLRRRKPGRRDAFRAWLSGAAWMERAAVHAFERLARELEAHDAPPWLVREARRAARDEARHARIVGRVARERGLRVPPVRFRSHKTRSLAAIARENAVEGCVHETYAALVAALQAKDATDEGVRDAMKRIAPDEKRHAALSLAVADWIEPRLAPRSRKRVDTARRESMAGLVARLARANGISLAGIRGGEEAARAAATLFERCR